MVSESPGRRSGTSLLEVKDLQVEFAKEDGLVRAVDGVSLSVDPGQILGLVGESGCGKSVTALSTVRLVPSPPGRITGGQVLWRGRDVLKMPTRELPQLRGREIAMIFQDPTTSLNPVFTIQRQLAEVLKKRHGLSGAPARRRAIESLETVGLSDAEERLSSYPHELSGGMQQRVMIATALLSEPKLLIADEPTTALDVTVQAQILALIKDQQQRTGLGILLITHDMGVVAETCDEVAVMYAGRIVERCSTVALFEDARHPYSRGLLDSIPKRDLSKETPLPMIEGSVPAMTEPLPGCRFGDRCAWAEERCALEDPVSREVVPGHFAACHFPLGAPRG